MDLTWTSHTLRPRSLQWASQPKVGILQLQKLRFLGRQTDRLLLFSFVHRSGGGEDELLTFVSCCKLTGLLILMQGVPQPDGGVAAFL